MAAARRRHLGTISSTFATVVAAYPWNVEVAADAGSAYWLTENEAGTLAARDLAGGDVRTLADDLRWPMGLAVDDEFVYVVECATDRLIQDSASGWLRRIAK